MKKFILIIVSSLIFVRAFFDLVELTGRYALISSGQLDGSTIQAATQLVAVIGVMLIAGRVCSRNVQEVNA